MRWLVIDCSSITDIDYSAGLNLAGLITALHAQQRAFAISHVDPSLLATVKKYGALDDFDNTHIYPTVQDAVTAFRADVPATQ